MISIPTPETIVRQERMGPHFTKYHLGGGKVLHHFTMAEDEYFHNHPWGFRTTILSGGYVEEIADILPDGQLITASVHRTPMTTHSVSSGTIHRLTGLLDGDCWTLIEPFEKEREWGFYRADESGVWHRFWHEPDWKLIVKTFQLQ